MHPSHPSRREFAATLALAGLAACAPGRAPAPTSPTAAPAAPAASDPDAPIVTALLAVVDARYAARLTAETRSSVRTGIARLGRLAAAVRTVPLANGVGPYSVCAASAPREGAR